jgi:hypothetical protein
VRHPGGTIEYVGRLSWRPLGHNPMPIVSLGLNRTEVDTARRAAQPSPTIGQWLNGDLGWLEAECNRCKTRASLLLDAIRRPRNTPIWKLERRRNADHASEGRDAPSVHMIKLTERQEITPYPWVHPNDER